MSNWEGYAVSVNCGEPLGCYQGTILQADGNTITLTKAFRNGFPYPKSQVTLNASDIKELKIIEARAQPSEQPTSTVAVTKNKKATRATVCESLEANHTNNNNSGPTTGSGGNKPTRNVARSKPIDITPARNKCSSHQGSGGGGLPGLTPKRSNLDGGAAAARRRNEVCFGAAASPADDDFDFEGNLALFDKRAIATQLRNKPDLLRQTEDKKYRHDENVLGSSLPECNSIVVPLTERAGEYLTDAAQRVPALTAQARGRAFQSLSKSPAFHTSLVLLARGLADVCLRVAGGERRLEARNAHQQPRAVALLHAGAVTAPAAAIAARLLLAHAVSAHVYCDGTITDSTLHKELQICVDHGVKLHSSLESAPAPDIIILALFDPVSNTSANDVTAMLQWSRSARAHVVSLEPPPDYWRSSGLARACVCALLPPALPAARGQLYLVNVAPPPKVFSELGIKYRPPFAASSAMPLHSPDADD